MTIVDATYQKVLICLVLRICQLCDIAHDFQADLHNIAEHFFVSRVFPEKILDKTQKQTQNGTHTFVLKC
jgi:hypothetical protein